MGVFEPLNLTWRKFLLVIRGLRRPDSRFLNAVWLESPEALREMLNKKMGRDNNNVRRRRVDNLDEFLAGMN